MCDLIEYFFARPEEVLLCIIFSMLFSLCLVMLMQKCGRSWRARRNEEQVENEMLMRRGFKKAGRLGWVKL